jgi:heme-degrading monooxygenase HmoA
MSINRVSIWDMDGVLACSLWRYRTITNEQGQEVIDLAHWREHEHLCAWDDTLPHAVQYRADLADPQCYVIIATAREAKQPDFDWIKSNLGWPDYMIYRKRGDNQSGKTLKGNALARLLALRQFRNVRDVTMYEDNISYLKFVCDKLQIRGVYVPSKQGH